jgi:hypothetical protein
VLAKEASSANPSIPLHEVLEVGFAILSWKIASRSSRTRPPPDQFFSGSQFESYCVLGPYTMEILCAECGAGLRRFTGEILATHLAAKKPDWLTPLIQASPNATGAIGGI